MEIPPGQSLTQKFPVVGEKLPPEEAVDIEQWTLEISGLVTNDRILTYPSILALAQDKLTADIHCVTSWSQYGMTFTGIRLRDLLSRLDLRPLSDARYVRFEAYSERNHDTSLPLALALDDAWLVHAFEGQPLTPSHGYPLRVVTPSRYFYKSVKWLRRITLLEKDQLGFWERTSGYHNNGDPWKEERWEGARFTSGQDAAAFRALSNFDAWRHSSSSEPSRVIVKADFRNWCPCTRDLSALHLKACDFRNAQLDNVDFTGANLTLGKFTGASLRNVDFADADLEGADFSGADLTGARFARNDLSAATFTRDGRSLIGHDGLTMTQPKGLLESQRDYLTALRILQSPPTR